MKTLIKYSLLFLLCVAAHEAAEGQNPPAGSITIGIPVNGGTPTDCLTVGATGNLSQAPCGGGGGSGTVTGVLGTANQVSVTNSTTTPTVSLPSAIVLPGTLSTVAANPATVGLFRSSSGDQSCWRDSGNTSNACITLVAAGILGVSTGAAGTAAGGFQAAQYYGTSPQAAAGLLRLGSTDTLNWRNNANTADIVLGKNTSDQFTMPALLIGAGSAITSSGPGGALTSNAFSSTAFAPLASPTFTGTVTIPNGGVFSTPTSMTATNVTGLPISTGVTGLGAGVATVLAVANVTTTVAAATFNANTCSASAVTVTMAGVATMNAFVFTPTADTSGTTGWGSTGGLVIEAWPTANTLNYKVCNQTGSNITSSAGVTFNVGVR